jgi:hypothetical protein
MAPEIALAPDGSPVVLSERRLIRRTPAGWVEYATLPIPADRSFSVGSDGFSLGRDGNIYFIEWDPELERAVLWESRKGSWSATTIPQFPEGSPNFYLVRPSPKGRPALVVGRIQEPYGWLRVLRREH